MYINLYTSNLKHRPTSGEMNVKYGRVHVWDVASAPYISVYIQQYSSHKDMTHKRNRQKNNRRLCVTSPSWEAPWRSTWTAFTKPALGFLRAASCSGHSNCFDGLGELMFLSDLMSDGNTELVAAASNSFSWPFCQEKERGDCKRRRQPREKGVFIKSTAATMTADHIWSCSIPWILNSHQCLCVPAGYLPDSYVVFKSHRNDHIYEMGHYNVVLTNWKLMVFFKRLV